MAEILAILVLFLIRICQKLTKFLMFFYQFSVGLMHDNSKKWVTFFRLKYEQFLDFIFAFYFNMSKVRQSF